MIVLTPKPLSKENFAEFGTVIESDDHQANQMNGGTFQRFDDLARVDAAQIAGTDLAPATTHISIVRSQVTTPLPTRFTLVECHPLCSQAFIPLSEFRFYVVVAPAKQTIDAGELRAFVTNGRQGISYFPGTWHMPLIAQEPGQEFLVVDQAARPGNLREHVLPHEVQLDAAS